MKKGFTLIELLVVVAIVAVVGAGVAVMYGREVVDDAKRQMTLHEMGQIRDAFSRFMSENSAQMYGGLTVGDDTIELPDSFSSKFAASDSYTYNPPTLADPQRFYGVVEFFERYGLWPLLSKSVRTLDDEKPVQIFSSISENRRYAFNEPSFTTGEGWRGPYIDAVERVQAVDNSSAGHIPEGLVGTASSFTGITSGNAIASSIVRFPQIATKYNDDANGGFYRVIYFEHCKDTEAGATIYRRLLLAAFENPLAYDTWDELKVFCGNRRSSGIDLVSPVDFTTGAVAPHIKDKGAFFMELLNKDTACP